MSSQHISLPFISSNHPSTPPLKWVSSPGQNIIKSIVDLEGNILYDNSQFATYQELYNMKTPSNDKPPK